MFGRDDEIDLVSKMIIGNYNSKSVVISSFNGMPAIGKTTLAVKLAHLFSYKYPDAQLFIDCYGYTIGQKPLSSERILDSLLFSLNISKSKIPEKYEDKILLWRKELSYRSAIIVLDNVKSEEQIKDLLLQNSKSLFLITSRSKLMISDSYSLEVDILNDDDAILILNNGKPENDCERYNLLKKLSHKYGNLPYALQIISRQISGRGIRYISRLVNKCDTFENLSVSSNAVYSSFDISYQNLGARERSLFQVLGMFPGSEFTPSSSAAMLGVEKRTIYKSLDILYNQKLIKEVSDDRYVMHDLMRDFSRKKYYEVHDDDFTPIIRLINFYVGIVQHCCKKIDPYASQAAITSEHTLDIYDLPESKDTAFLWITLESENILSCLDLAKEKKWDLLYFSLAYVMSSFVLKRLSGWRVIKIYEYIITCHGLEKWMYAAALTVLGKAYHQTGQFNEAVSFFAQAEENWTILNNKSALADTLGSHAFTLERLGRYAESLSIIDKALQYERELNHLYGIANALNSKGAVYWRIKEYSKAKDLFEEVLELRNEIGDEFGASSSINNLAFTMLKLGNEQDARKGFYKSLQLSTEHKDLSGEAVTLNNLGYTELFAKQPNQAINYAVDAFNVAIQVDDEYQIARSYDVKGRAYLQMGNKENAVINLKKALSLFEKLSVPEVEDEKRILQDAMN